ncbi:MAG: hypothetical protein JST66_11030 [Bacteroidetes bacterium]|nr:hypothetical protein [Bacteroidota bacterium]
MRLPVSRPIPVALATLLAACGGPARPPVDDAPKAPVIGSSEAPTEHLYQMPTPNELFHIVREMAGEGQKRMMNPSVNVDRYVTLPARALNFGVYATDMVYASSFRLTSEVARYYLTCKKLGDELGLSSAFDDADFVRLERNVARGDSMDVISNEAYYRVYQRMQDDRMGPTLSLVLAGGWVESMHLVMSQVIHFDPADPLVARVAEQKASLEHLIDLMDAFGQDPLVEPTRMQLAGIRAIYDELNVRRTPHPGTSPSGRMVLGDDITVSMDAEKFAELDQAVRTLREAIIRPEDRPRTPNA